MHVFSGCGGIFTLSFFAKLDILQSLVGRMPEGLEWHLLALWLSKQQGGIKPCWWMTAQLIFEHSFQIS